MAELMKNTEYKQIKASLISAIACEYRHSLWFPLVEALGIQKTLALLNAAESTAKANTKTLPFSSLIE
jgi:hypothetical protein